MIYSICNLNIKMNPKYKYSKKRAKKYLSKNQNSTPNIIINITKSMLLNHMEKYENQNKFLAEYSLLGMMLFEGIINYNGYVLHSSAVSVNNQGYVFTAPSGTGKSTHAKLWIKHFKKNNAKYINDDKPIIRLINNKFYVCGTPFSGKNDLNSNIIVPLKAIYVLEQGKTNKIEKLNPKNALNALYTQTYFKNTKEQAIKLLNLIEKTINSTQIFKLKCNKEIDSVVLGYESVNHNNK